jgi:hypothetical protein
VFSGELVDFGLEFFFGAHEFVADGLELGDLFFICRFDGFCFFLARGVNRLNYLLPL